MTLLTYRTLKKEKIYNSELMYEQKGILKTHNKKAAALISKRQKIISPLIKTNQTLQKRILKFLEIGKPLTPIQEKTLIQNVSLFLKRVELTTNRFNLLINQRQTGLSNETIRLMHTVLGITAIRQGLIALEEEGLAKKGIYQKCLIESGLKIKGTTKGTK